MKDWSEPLDPEERDRILQKVADGIVRRGMETPAILFLEMNKPLSFFASQGLIVMSPFVAPFIGFENVQIATRVLEDRDNIERLIRRIEDLALARQDERKNKKPVDPAPKEG